MARVASSMLWCVWVAAIVLLPLAVSGAQTDAASYRTQLEPDAPEALGQALNMLFALRSQSGDAADLFLCRKRVLSLMVRQRIPAQIQTLRALSDAELYRLAVLAAIAGLGQWKRDVARNGTLLIDDRGRLIRELVPDTVQSDVMLCIVCALLTMIAVSHVILASATAANVVR